MKNKKGFTLIELLAVIVILVTISAIAIPSITASVERSKKKQHDAKVAIIIESAKLYYSENKRIAKNSTCYIEMQELDLTDKELENPYGGNFTGYVVYNNGNFEYWDTLGNEEQTYSEKCIG